MVKYEVEISLAHIIGQQHIQLWIQGVRIGSVQTAAKDTLWRITWVGFLGHEHEAEYIDSGSFFYFIFLKRKSFELKMLKKSETKTLQRFTASKQRGRYIS